MCRMLGIRAWGLLPGVLSAPERGSRRRGILSRREPRILGSAVSKTHVDGVVMPCALGLRPMACWLPASSACPAVPWVTCWGPWRASRGAHLPYGHFPEPSPCPAQGSRMTPSPATTWLFRENHECVEKTLMALKTEDPAVFTVYCECPQPGPGVPSGQPQPTQGPAQGPEMLTVLAAGVGSSLWPIAAHRPCLLPPSEVILGVMRPEAPTPSSPVASPCLAKVEGRGQVSYAPWGWVRWADTCPPPCSLTSLWFLKNLQNKPDLWAGGTVHLLLRSGTFFWNIPGLTL